MAKSSSSGVRRSAKNGRFLTGGAPTGREAKISVRNAKTGQFVTVKGVGALKGSAFSIKKGLDLTKPIAKQALKGSPKGEGI